MFVSLSVRQFVFSLICLSVCLQVFKYLSLSLFFCLCLRDSVASSLFLFLPSYHHSLCPRTFSFFASLCGHLSVSSSLCPLNPTAPTSDPKIKMPGMDFIIHVTSRSSGTGESLGVSGGEGFQVQFGPSDAPESVNAGPDWNT